MHGHSYVFTLHCVADNNKLNDLGMVIDFGDIKRLLCQWLEDAWDHKFLIWDEDPLNALINGCTEAHYVSSKNALEIAHNSFVVVLFNPTAENIAEYFVTHVAPEALEGNGHNFKKLHSKRNKQVQRNIHAWRII